MALLPLPQFVLLRLLEYVLLRLLEYLLLPSSLLLLLLLVPVALRLVRAKGVGDDSARRRRVLLGARLRTRLPLSAPPPLVVLPGIALKEGRRAPSRYRASR